MPGFFRLADIHEIAEEVIVLRPVDQGDAPRIRSRREVGRVNEAPVGPPSPVVRPRVERQGTRFERDRMAVGETQQGAGPGGSEVGYVVAPECVLGGPFDDVIFSVHMLHGEAPGGRLHILRLRLGGGMRLAGLIHRFRAGNVLDAGQREYIPQLRGVDKEGGGQFGFVSRAFVAHPHGFDAVARHARRNAHMFQQYGELPAAYISGQHFFQHGQRDARFVADARNPAVPRIERVRGFPGKRISPAVKGPHPPPEIEVRCRRPELFDPWMFVGGNRLLGQLPADPVRFFGQNHPGSAAQGPQCCCDAACAAANDCTTSARRSRAGGCGPSSRAWCAPSVPTPATAARLQRKFLRFIEPATNTRRNRNKTPLVMILPSMIRTTPVFRYKIL